MMQLSAHELGTAGGAVPASRRGIGAQAAGVLGLLTGVWVALSPWFITLQDGGSNATAVDLISGLAVAAVGAFAVASPGGSSGLQLGSLLLGIWLIISPPILDQKHPIAHAMYWSNSFSGGMLIALAAAGLSFAALRRTARRPPRAAQRPRRRPQIPASLWAGVPTSALRDGEQALS